MPILSLRNVSKSFGAHKVTHDGIFEVREGRALGIIGPNGAGKSTLFNLITGILVADAGTIAFGGRDVTRVQAMVRCWSGIGPSFQIPQPFSKLTVFENLLVAGAFCQGRPEAEVSDACAGILERTGLLRRAAAPAGTLTLRERKRLELARALATAPRLLLLDEVASGPAEAECRSPVSTIRGIHAQGVTFVWIEHVLHALTSVVERLFVLDFWRAIGIGDPAEIMESREVREIHLGIEV